MDLYSLLRHTISTRDLVHNTFSPFFHFQIRPRLFPILLSINSSTERPNHSLQTDNMPLHLHPPHIFHVSSTSSRLVQEREISPLFLISIRPNGLLLKDGIDDARWSVYSVGARRSGAVWCVFLSGAMFSFVLSWGV